MNESEKLKHRNANRKCRDPLNIHPDKKKVYKDTIPLTSYYVSKHPSYGLYVGQKLCRLCRGTVNEWDKEKKKNTDNEQQDDIVNCPPQTSREKSPEHDNSDTLELEVQFVADKLKTIRKELEEMKISATRIVRCNDTLITKEVSFRFLIEISIASHKKIGLSK